MRGTRSGLIACGLVRLASCRILIRGRGRRRFTLVFVLTLILGHLVGLRCRLVLLLLGALWTVLRRFLLLLAFLFAGGLGGRGLGLRLEPAVRQGQLPHGIDIAALGTRLALPGCPS